MRKMHNIPITGQILEHILDYNPDTGIFRRKLHGKIGEIAGQTSTWGYRQIKIPFNKKMYNVAAHRLAWMWMYGKWSELEIDHINRDKQDNRIANLREATRSQNQIGIRRHRDSKQPFKGVSQLPGGRWRAVVTKNYKRIHIGVYDTPEEARAAYMEAASRLHGEFANAG